MRYGNRLSHLVDGQGDWGAGLLMARSLIRLPADAGEDFEVYLNGVRQRPDVDFELDDRTLVFDRRLRRDHVSRWRWFLGAWGVGTYRQDDVVDVRYMVDDDVRVGHAMPISVVDDELEPG